MDKRERAATRAEQEQAQQAQRAAAFRARDKALEENYLRYGCKVLKTGGSWAKETIRQADAWGAQNKERWELLVKGEQFRTLPEEMVEEEARMALRREQITLVRQIRTAVTRRPRVREAAERERQAQGRGATTAGGEREYSTSPRNGNRYF